MATQQERKFRIAIDPLLLVPSTKHRRFYLLSLGMIVVMAAVVLYYYRYLPSQIPLYFTKPWGEARLAQKAMIWLLPTMPLVFILINLLTNRAVKEEMVLSQILSAATLVVTLMVVVALSGILQSVL